MVDLLFTGISGNERLFIAFAHANYFCNLELNRTLQLREAKL